MRGKKKRRHTSTCESRRVASGNESLHRDLGGPSRRCGGHAPRRRDESRFASPVARAIGKIFFCFRNNTKTPKSGRHIPNFPRLRKDKSSHFGPHGFRPPLVQETSTRPQKNNSPDVSQKWLAKRGRGRADLTLYRARLGREEIALEMKLIGSQLYPKWFTRAINSNRAYRHFHARAFYVRCIARTSGWVAHWQR